jgi:protein-S-isoprenylcysteine O-methyltransferase Ste14
MSARFKFGIIIELFLIFGLFPFLAVLLNTYLDWPVLNSIYNMIGGILLLIIGILIIVLSARDLVINSKQEIIKPTRAPPKFITEGIYQYVRNPMYLDDFFVVLSEFFIFGHTALLGYFFLLISLVHLAVVYQEEPTLEAAFGSDYLDYKARVPRWFPKFTRKNKE